MQLTAVYTGTEFRVHEARCPDIRDLGWPDIREEVHLSAAGKAEAVERVWAGSLAAPSSIRDAARRTQLTKFASCCLSELEFPPATESGFDEGTPYFEVYPGSGPDAFSTKKHPTFISQSMAEHNARRYSRDGRDYAVEHVDSDGKRSKVAEFRNGRKVLQPR